MPADIGNKIVLRESTVKVRMPKKSIPCGIDVVQWYSKPMSKPKLTLQVGTVLEQIGAEAQSKQARLHCKNRLRELVKTSKDRRVKA